MLNLQTITEELGTICSRRAWVVVTSQEDMDAVIGDMGKTKKQYFSKIQGRFFPPLSLSSANVDEVIQSRLLAKEHDVVAELEDAFKQRGDILKSQLTFKNCGMTFRQFKDTDDFVKNYPFAPYQFQLIQKIFEAIRKAGATGTHVSVAIPDEVAAEIMAAMELNENPLYAFWNTGTGKPQTAVTNWQHDLRQVFRAAGMPEGHPHQLRDTFAVALLEKGVPLEDVSRALGHESIKTTERYYAKWVKARQDRLDALVSATWASEPELQRRTSR
jgi:hypothetical protein